MDSQAPGTYTLNFIPKENLVQGGSRTALERSRD